MTGVVDVAGRGRRGDFIERYIRTHSAVKVEVITSACGSSFVFLFFICMHSTIVYNCFELVYKYCLGHNYYANTV